MLSITANYIADILYQKLNFPIEKKAVYVYGLELIVSTLASMISIILIALWMDRLLDAFIFLTVFISFRVVCGGYHAKTYSRCFFSSIGTFLFSSGLSMVLANSAAVLLLGVFSGAVISLWAPISNSCHPLSYKARKRNRSLALLLFSISFCWIVYRVFRESISHSLCLLVASIVAVATLMIVAKIQERRKRT
jgi:accessory gene regulator B